MSTIIGCESESTGRFIRCADCPFADDPERCLTWRRANNAKTTIGIVDEGFPGLFPEMKVTKDEYRPFCNKKIR